jgi:hypothetical protein
MTPQAKASDHAANPAPRGETRAGPWPPSPWVPPVLTTEDRLQLIKALGQRIAAHVQFMCQVGALDGTSAEMKDRAVAAFYERLVLAESELGRIQEGLRLG